MIDPLAPYREAGLSALRALEVQDVPTILYGVKVHRPVVLESHALRTQQTRTAVIARQGFGGYERIP